jgi:hypothetical protein
VIENPLASFAAPTTKAGIVYLIIGIISARNLACTIAWK